MKKLIMNAALAALLSTASTAALAAERVAIGVPDAGPPDVDDVSTLEAVVRAVMAFGAGPGSHGGERCANVSVSEEEAPHAGEGRLQRRSCSRDAGCGGRINQ